MSRAHIPTDQGLNGKKEKGSVSLQYIEPLFSSGKHVKFDREGLVTIEAVTIGKGDGHKGSHMSILKDTNKGSSDIIRQVVKEDINSVLESEIQPLSISS